MLRIAIAAATLALVGCSTGSPEDLCKKLGELAAKDGQAFDDKAMESCKKELAEQKAKVDAKIWGEVSQCVHKLESIKDVDRCDPRMLAAREKVKGTGHAPADTYIKKSKGTEAQQFIKKMYDGARAYYMDAGYSRASLEPIPPQFPGPSVGPTPPLGTCCKQGGKCVPDMETFNHPTWIALQFSVDDPHYYSYEYKLAQDGKSFEVLAYGDLDCDGTYSTFSLRGEVKPGEDGPTGAAAIIKTDPLE